jgi:DNA-binding MarR family transcriptional regulator
MSRTHAVKRDRAEATADYAEGARVRLASIKPRSDAGRALAELGWTVYETYFRLKEPGDRLTAPHKQSAARFVLMRILALCGPSTVAQTARVRATARQAIQRVADDLNAEGLVQYVDNPSHQRSKLLKLTTRGWEVLLRIAMDEAVGFDRLAQGANPTDLRTASRVLREFKARVTGHSWPRTGPSRRISV